MITGLDHVHVICKDVDESSRYFERVFDGKVVSRGEIRGLPMVRVEVKGVVIALMGTSSAAGQLIPGKGSPGLDHFGFQVKDLEGTVAELKKKGGKFSLEPAAIPGGVKYAFLDGPDGIRIELVER